MSKKSADKQGYVLYRSWTPVISSLSDADAGKLFKAIARYQDGNIVDICDELGQSYLFGIFEMMRLTFDRDRAEYDAKCAMRREVGRAGGRASAQKRAKEQRNSKSNQIQPIACKFNQNEANRPDIEKDLEIDLESDIGKDIKQDPLDHTSLSDPVLEALRTWIDYKKERREGYKSAGLKALISRVEKAEAQHGAGAVVELIEDCMSAGYRGIVWKLLRDKANPGKSSPVKRNQFTEMELRQVYDFEEIERESLIHD